MAAKLSKIMPQLWFTKDVEEAARFYTSTFPDSRLERVSSLPSESPSGPAGSVIVVDFTLFGQSFSAFSAGPFDPFNHAISLVVHCDDQAELDRYWNAFLQGGGKAEQCGWLRDKWGVCWQIQPRILSELITDTDRAKAKRVCDAMLQMVKLDIAGLLAAANKR